MKNEDQGDMGREKKPLQEGAAELGFSDVRDEPSADFSAVANQNSAELAAVTTKAHD